MEQAYYAVDPCDQGQAAQALRVCFEGSLPNVHWFALVDLAFVTESTSAMRAFGQFAPASLFVEPPLDKLKDASPALIALHDESGARMAQASKLLRLAHGMPMLGWVSTSRSCEEQIAAWQPYVYPRCLDEQRFVLRLADARVAAGLRESLSDPHWRGLTAGLQSWLIVGREGTVSDLIDKPSTPDPSPAREPMCLAADELRALMELGEPDAVIGSLHEKDADSLPKVNRARLHACIAQACRLARGAGIDRFEDLVCLSHAVLLSDGAVLADPRLKPLLAQQPARGQLADALLELFPQA